MARFSSVSQPIVRAFGRFQRPISWGIFIGGWLSLIGVISNIIATGDTKFAAILGSVLIISEGYAAIQAVENELQEGGEADS